MDLNRLIATIEPGSRLLRSWPLIGGLSAQMTALEIVLPDGQTKKLVVRQPGAATLKRNPNAAADEFRLLQLLQSVGVPVPTPYHLEPNGPLVIEHIEGRVEYAPANMADFIEQAATTLTKIHKVDTVLPANILEQSKEFAEKAKMRLADADFAPEGRRIREILESAMSLAQVNKSVLLHGDYWPGNLLWREGVLVAVIDWEDAVLGDPLADLAISRLDNLFLFGVDAMNAFTRHYLSLMTIDMTNLPYWDLLTALRAAPNIAEWSAGYSALGRGDITEQTMRDALDLFIAQALANC